MQKAEFVGKVQERLGLADHAVRLGHARHDVRVARDGLAVTIVGERIPAKQTTIRQIARPSRQDKGGKGARRRRSLRSEDKILECLAATADDGDDLHEDAVLLLTGRAECRDILLLSKDGKHNQIEIASALTAGRCIRRTWPEAWQESGLGRGAWPSAAGRSTGSTAGPWRRRTCASTPAVQNRRVSFRRQRERRVVRRGHQSSVQSMVQPRARPNSIQSRDNIAAVVLFFALLLPTGPGTYPRPAKLPTAPAAMRSDPARPLAEQTDLSTSAEADDRRQMCDDR